MFAELIDAECTPDLSDKCIMHVRPLRESIPVFDDVDAVMRGGIAFRSVDDAITTRRALPHGHVAAVLGTCRPLGLARILHRLKSRTREVALGAIVARVISPQSKLATARELSPQSANSTLGRCLNLGVVTGNEMRAMLDWLLKRQP